YVNEKVPFAYDYADHDPDVLPVNSEHGTHVAGIIAGKDEEITGVAPNAQLAIFKVFSDSTDGAKSAWILAAVEDCVNLGVDVINMSLGAGCGFCRETDKENVNEIYDSVKEAGISLIVAAGNSYSSATGSEKNGNNPLTSNPDTGTVSSPGTYDASLTVASVNGVNTPSLRYNGEIIYFTEAFTNSADQHKSFVNDVLKKIGEINGQTYDSYDFEYVTIPGIGRSSDYPDTEDYYKGKIVLVKRGTTTFEEKVRIALNEMGAAGIIIYNNVSGDISMSVGADIGAVCSISQDNGELLAAHETGILTVSKVNTAGPFMSDFSAWGPTPDLKIKPEITAHGGEIYSAVPGGKYERMSGTSMAAPNQAGATAIVRQFVKYSGEFGTDGVDLSDKQVTALVNQLMMSTADIILNKNGLAYAVRKQGAGLVNLTKSAKTAAYITTYDNGVAMDKSKIEFGDDKNKTGVYETTFTINDFKDDDVSYDLGSIVLTEGVATTFTGHGERTVTQDGYLLNSTTTVTAVSGEGSKNENTVTVKAGKTLDVTVKIVLSEEDKRYLDSSFANGMYVEGFITLTAKSGTDVNLNAPFLAFYGDWTKAPLFDEEYYDTNVDELNKGLDERDKVMADSYATRIYGGLYSDYITTLGSYMFTQDPAATPIAADKDKIAVSNQDAEGNPAASSVRSILAGLLRNAKKMTVSIVEDSTGIEIYNKVINDTRKSYSNGGNTIYGISVDIDFKPLEYNLKNNTKYTVTVDALLDYDGEQNNERSVFTFPLYIDFEAPSITKVEFRTEREQTSGSVAKTKLFADSLYS
ncbi:MAG: S8 family serine peptidase, partial [Clostridia bacterium]|nr:S8 family serine peptidase [Clostridia bacterium]